MPIIEIKVDPPIVTTFPVNQDVIPSYVTVPFTIIVQKPDGLYTFHKMIQNKVEALDRGQGVLILTDMFGGTPSNISLSFLKEGQVEVLTGVNLPMVLAIARNRSDSTLSEVAKTAEEAGKMSISLASKLLMDSG